MGGGFLNINLIVILATVVLYVAIAEVFLRKKPELGLKLEEEKQEEVIELTSAEIMERGINALFEASEGNILKVSSRSKDTGWKVVDVTLTDMWHKTSFENKKNFTEETVRVLESILVFANQVKEDEEIRVYFLDINEELLAWPSIGGGHNIE